jgi:hypothetical protein
MNWSFTGLRRVLLAIHQTTILVACSRITSGLKVEVVPRQKRKTRVISINGNARWKLGCVVPRVTLPQYWTTILVAYS